MPQRPYLDASRWINEFPNGFRLRWQFNPDEVINGRFIGLPDRVYIERSFVNTQVDTFYNVEAPTVSKFPISWWDSLGDFTLPKRIRSRYFLPKKVQGIKFTYKGSAAKMRVWDSKGELVFHRAINAGEFVFLESSDIKSISFFNGNLHATVELENVRILDLFDNHDAGVIFQTIATIEPKITTNMDFNEAYKRYSGVPTMTADDWKEFQEVIVKKALNSTPATVEATPGEIAPWTVFQTMLAFRWEYTQLYGMGFVDGPNTPTGATVDNINQGLIFAAQPPVSPNIMYRIRCVYNDLNLELTSNPVVCISLQEQDLLAPISYAYENAYVRLYGEQDYEEENTMEAAFSDKRVIGLEIEENFNASPILGQGGLSDNYFFRSWRPEDSPAALNFLRKPSTAFYDQPMRFRARCIDGWDRESPFGAWTALKLPKFIHNPMPPSPLSAWCLGNEVTIVASNDSQSFSTWGPDHAVKNTPNSQLEVFRKTAEPITVTTTVAAPQIYYGNSGSQKQSFGVPVPAAITDPTIFRGGQLIAGKMRATIDDIVNNQFIFSAIPNGANQASTFMAGEAIFQQAYNDISLYELVASFPIGTLPERLTFTDILPDAEKTVIDNYVLRVNMQTLQGDISNTVEVIRNPAKPETPPPFSIDVLGVDFYNRTLLRLDLDQPTTAGKFNVYWAEGTQALDTFDEVAARGTYVEQSTHKNRFLYDLLSLPVPKQQAFPITIGLQAVNDGGFKSPFSIVHFDVPVYEQL